MECDICLEKDELLASSNVLCSLLEKHLQIEVWKDVASCGPCMQVLQMWDSFSVKAVHNLTVVLRHKKLATQRVLSLGTVSHAFQATNVNTTVTQDIINIDDEDAGQITTRAQSPSGIITPQSDGVDGPVVASYLQEEPSAIMSHTRNESSSFNTAAMVKDKPANAREETPVITLDDGVEENTAGEHTPPIDTEPSVLKSTVVEMQWSPPISQVEVKVEADESTPHPSLTQVAQQMSCDTRIISQRGAMNQFAPPDIKTENETMAMNYSCSQCNKKFVHKRSLYLHRKVFHNNVRKDISIGMSVKCTLCPALFKTNQELSDHVQILHLPLKFKCKFCSTTFTSAGSSFDDHKSMLESVQFEHYRTECVGVNSQLKRNVNNGAKSQEISSVSSNYDGTLRGNACEAESFSCGICPANFTCKCLLKQHIKKHLNQDTSASNEKRTNSKATRLSRNQRKHVNTKKFECKYCFKIFKKKTNLKMHLETRHPDKRKLFSVGKLKNKFLGRNKKYINCYICDKVFKRNGIRIHLAKVHSLGPAHAGAIQCAEGSNQLFVTNEQMLNTCQQQQSAKATPGNIEIVRSLQTVEHQGYSSKQKDGLLSSIDEFECSICKKTFSSHLSLMMHLKAHIQMKLQLKVDDNTINTSINDSNKCEKRNVQLEFSKSLASQSSVSDCTTRCQGIQKKSNEVIGLFAYRCLYCGETLPSVNNVYLHAKECHPPHL